MDCLPPSASLLRTQGFSAQKFIALAQRAAATHLSHTVAQEGPGEAGAGQAHRNGHKEGSRGAQAMACITMRQLEGQALKGTCLTAPSMAEVLYLFFASVRCI